MKTPLKLLLTSLLAAAGFAFGTISMQAASATQQFLVNEQKGQPPFKSVGRISFGPYGLLLVADPRDAAFYAIDTGDNQAAGKPPAKLEDVGGMLAARMGAPAKSVQVQDMAVNPASGRVYFSIQKQGQPAILVVESDGKASPANFKTARYVRITLPVGDSAKLRNLSDIAFATDRVVVAGQSNEEFSSKIFTIPLPLKHGEAAEYASAETYHVSHRRWETKAPIQSFIPYEENGQQYIVGAFACTPLAKFPVGGIKGGEKLKGISVVELGSGNRPRDMFTYSSGGRDWLVTNTKRFKTLFGPSAYWGARVDMKYLGANDAASINENAPRRNAKNPRGIEVVDALFGAILVSQYDNNQVVVLRENGELQDLELVALP